MNDRQTRAVATLIAACETIAASGLLGEPSERLLREQIADALIAFGMFAANRDEREAAHA
jgi:hypothetical protein